MDGPVLAHVITACSFGSYRRIMPFNGIAWLCSDLEKFLSLMALFCPDGSQTYGNYLVQVFKVSKDVKLFKIYSIKTRAVARLANICIPHFQSNEKIIFFYINVTQLEYGNAHTLTVLSRLLNIIHYFCNLCKKVCFKN